MHRGQRRVHRAKAAGLGQTKTPAEAAHYFIEQYGSGAATMARDRISKAGTPEKERYWEAVSAELAKLPPPPRGSSPFGRCASCGSNRVRLPASLAADTTKHVCARCAANPEIATVPR